MTPPVIAEHRWPMTALSEPIRVGGQVAARVTVRPGDFVLEDRDGVVVVPRELQGAVLEAA